MPSMPSVAENLAQSCLTKSCIVQILRALVFGHTRLLEDAKRRTPRASEASHVPWQQWNGIRSGFPEVTMRDMNTTGLISRERGG